MSKFKKALTLVLVIALTAGLAITGTMAYLTQDVGEKQNVFSVGNIDISLSEEVGVYGEGGEVDKTDDGAAYTEIMPGDYLQKEVTVTNEGKTDAYVAVTVTLNNALEINNAIDEVYGDGAEGGQAKYDFIFDGWGINQDPRPGAYGNNDARGVIDGTYGLPEHVLHVDYAKTTNGSTVIGANNWFIAGKEKAGQYWVDGPAEYDGYYTANMEDCEICYTYYLYLPAGESSTLFNGLNVPAEFDADQLAMFDGLEINVEAKAIQADNMGVHADYKDDTTNGEAKTAFAVLAGKISADSLDVDNNPTSIVYNLDELNAALEKGGRIIFGDNIDASGVTGGVLQVAKDADINLKGFTLTGAVSAKEDVNLTIKNGSVINNSSAVSCIESYGNLVLEGVNVESGRHTVYIQAGTAIINSGTYKTIEADEAMMTKNTLYVKGGTVTVNGGDFYGPKGTATDSGAALSVPGTEAVVTINGGSFSKGQNSTLSAKGTLIINAGTFDQDPNAYVADGHNAVETDGIWTVE